MTYKQTNTENTGIEDFSLKGYQHHDALWFDADKHETYWNFANGLLHIYPYVERVLELGSGAGSLAYHLRNIKNDLTVITLDGNIEAAEISPYIKKDNHFVCRTDIKYDIEDDNGIVKFDLILSFEHFEHIQDEMFQTFIDNIKRHSTTDTIVHASAANWDGGYQNIHCNIKSKEQWDEIFVKNGFEVVNGISLFKDYNNPFNFNKSMSTELIYKYNI